MFQQLQLKGGCGIPSFIYVLCYGPDCVFLQYISYMVISSGVRLKWKQICWWSNKAMPNYLRYIAVEAGRISDTPVSEDVYIGLVNYYYWFSLLPVTLSWTVWDQLGVSRTAQKMWFVTISMTEGHESILNDLRLHVFLTPSFGSWLEKVTDSNHVDYLFVQRSVNLPEKHNSPFYPSVQPCKCIRFFYI